MRRALTVMTVTMLALTACGSDDDDAAERLTLDEFLTQGNAICAAGNEAVNELFSASFADEEPDAEELAAFFADDFGPIIQGQIDDFGALDAPEDVEAAVDQFLTDAQAVLDDILQQAEDDPGSIFASNEDPFTDVNAQAIEIGLTVCAEDAGDDGEGGGDDSTGADAAGDVVADPDNPYCAVEAEIDALFEATFSELDPSASTEEQLGAMTTASQAVVESGLLDQVEELAPDAIAGDLDVLVAAVLDAAEGDREAFTSVQTEEAGARVDAFCGQ